MNKIICLILFGAALALVHMPGIVLTIGTIACLVTVSVKLFWLLMEAFSDSSIRYQ